MTKQQDLKNEVFKALDDVDKGVFKLFVDEEDDEIMVGVEMTSLFNGLQHDRLVIENTIADAVLRFYGYDVLSDLEELHIGVETFVFRLTL